MQKKSGLTDADRMMMRPFIARLKALQRDALTVKDPLLLELMSQEIALMRRRLRQWKRNPQGTVFRTRALKPVRKP